VQRRLTRWSEYRSEPPRQRAEPGFEARVEVKQSRERTVQARLLEWAPPLCVIADATGLRFGSL